MIKNLIPESIKAPIRAHFDSRRAFRSQVGQDFWVMGEVFDEKRGGFFLDIGAHDGVQLSNTYVLEKKYGWDGICIEANPESFKQLTLQRRAKCVNACLDAEDGFVSFAKRGLFGGIISKDTDNKSAEEASETVTLKTVSLASLLQDIQAPAEMDYLSIDIEGAEERVLANFPFERYRFKCMTIERPTAPLRSVLESGGYVLIKEIPGLDCFYVHDEFVAQYKANMFSYFRKKWLMLGVG